jgi:ATP dependent DNA ligase domain
VIPQYTPMARTRVRAPFQRYGRVYAEKVDGWRMLAYKDGERVRLVSRNGRDHTRRFPDLAAAVAAASKPWFRSLGSFYSSSTTTLPGHQVVRRWREGASRVAADWPTFLMKPRPRTG